MRNDRQRHGFVFGKLCQLISDNGLLNCGEHLAFFITASEPNKDLPELLEAFVSCFELSGIQVFPNAEEKGDNASKGSKRCKVFHSANVQLEGLGNRRQSRLLERPTRSAC